MGSERTERRAPSRVSQALSAKSRRTLIIASSLAVVGSLLLIQFQEVSRSRQRAGLAPTELSIPARSQPCVECHEAERPGLVEPWRASVHAAQGVACVECHEAGPDDPDGYEHHGERIATLVTPRDCGRCHADQAAEFDRSRHAQAAEIRGHLKETRVWASTAFDTGPADIPLAGRKQLRAAVCGPCHGVAVAVLSTSGERITAAELEPDADGRPTQRAVAAEIARSSEGFVQFAPDGGRGGGIGRLNLDGSRGSCAACHGRHDVAAFAARRPETCSGCHLGPDQPQKEVYESSPHGAAWRLAGPRLALDSPTWVLGRDYAAAPSCATCHLSGHGRNGGAITHDPGTRLSWVHGSGRSTRTDTTADGRRLAVREESDRALIVDTWQDKRVRMRQVCSNCHVASTIDAHYQRYDQLVEHYERRFGQPALEILEALQSEGLWRSGAMDEPIDWTLARLVHEDGRAALMGAAMMSPDRAYTHGLSRVAERFYGSFIPQARAITRQAADTHRRAGAETADALIDSVLARPEHQGLGAREPR